MMSQFSRFLLILLFSASAMLCIKPANAADDVVVTCDASCNVPELPLLSLSWAPSSTWQERVVVDNHASLSRELQAQLEVSGDASLISWLQASWKNGSHKVIRQGSLRDVAAETSLSTVPAKSKRVFYLAIALPRTVDNSLQNKTFKLNASLKITDMPKGAKAATSSTTKGKKSQIKTVASGVLGQSVSHPTYPLPTLQSRVLSSAPIQAAGQLVQAARKQLWWGWLIVAIEAVALMPWRFRIASIWQRGILEAMSILLAGLLSGWPAALAASLWLCIDLGRLSRDWPSGSFFNKATRQNLPDVIPSEVEESSNLTL